jgi:hypothetical protein
MSQAFHPWLKFKRLALALVVLLWAWVVPCGAGAQSLESVLAPGKLIQGHAKLEDECKNCHVKFDRNAQSGLCGDCHKEVATDIRAKTGYHGRLKPQACHDCHTEHKGRDAQIVNFDKKKFDHTQSDFVLREKHQALECEKCHVAGKKYREASTQCSVCHRKDDAHKGSLGVKCADCHNQTNWKESKFDHGTTRFALNDKHVAVKCVECHKAGTNYKDAPRACVGCHKKDDDGAKGHKGLYGEKCESCHGVYLWKTVKFNHDTDTKYLLRGKHATTACTTCHTGNVYRVKLSPDCNACHAKDDKHKGSLGKDCVSCHNERSWKEPAKKFDHNLSSFPLLGKHGSVECKECHKSPMFKEASKDCVACHRKDDKHNATLGEKCGDCHGERDWKTTSGRFSHDKTKFALRNAHALPTVKCVACHKDLTSMRKTSLECVSCHKKDDKHEGQEGLACQQCHDDRSWKVEKFDHRLTRFPLTGRHVPATCQSCHQSARYKDAPRDCLGCHVKEDKHKQTFGALCESCHNTRAWALWDFNHDKKTKYRLDGKHLKVGCESCHKQVAPKGKAAAPLGSDCVTCHRIDDLHNGEFGARCDQCHATESWKKIQRRTGQLRTSEVITLSARPMKPELWGANASVMMSANKEGVIL